MKTKLICAMAMACAVFQLAAMPTEEDVRRAEPDVKKLLAPERAALESGRKTRSEVAAAAMKLADEADSDAAKLLLMKGAFVLYVKDGNLEKAVETMNALEAAISDMPPQSVTNMIEMALFGVAKKEDRARLYKLLDEPKADIPSSIDLPSHIESKAIAASVKERSSVASILKSMIKLPGRDCWLSATELTQGQWEAVMGYNNSTHKGANLPVDNVSRDDCDVFLELLNKTKEVQASRFEFVLPMHGEWAYAAAAGCAGGWKCWIKPGVQGNILEKAWVKENSSNETHAVATKTANAFGFYDMQGNVSEWFLSGGEKGQIMGCSFDETASSPVVDSPVRFWYDIPRNRRNNQYGIRLAAHIRSNPSLDGQRSTGSSEAESAQQQATVDSYIWSYRVKNGEAMIVTTNVLCAVSPSPKGDVSIPSALGGAKVTSIGNNAFRNCRGLTSVTIPEGVTSIGDHVFDGCCELKLVTIPSSVRNIGEWAFGSCYALKSVTIPANVESIGSAAFWSCRGLTAVTIPAKVASIGGATFSYCSSLKQINVDADNQTFTSIDGVLYTKDRSILLACPNAMLSVKIPKSVAHIGVYAFEDCNKLTSVTIPEGVTSIEECAFKECGGLVSVTIPSSVKRIAWQAFWNCRGLKSATLQEGVEVIDRSAFNRCSGLTSLVLPSSVKSIGSYAFEGCDELTSLTLPQGLTTLYENAFRGLNKLTTMTIPASVTNIGGAVFSYCGGLTQINVEAENQKYTSVDGILYTKDRTELVMCPNGLKSVTIPESVTSIGLGAFIGCSKLTSVMLPSSVKSIGSWAFEGCNGFTSVTIPESVTKIDKCAFYGCGELTSLTMLGERPDAPNDIFNGCGKLKSIHVPANAKSWAGMKDWHGIPLVFDGEDAGRQAQAEPRPARLGGLARLRQRRMENAEKEREATERKREAEERAQQREALLQIQEQLRRQREERTKPHGTPPSPRPGLLDRVAKSPGSPTNGLWTVAQYNGSSSISSLVEAQKIVDQSPKVAERTYQTLSFANCDGGLGNFPHVEFPGTVGSVDLNYFVITATGSIYVPYAGEWTFACRSDDGFRFVISGNGLNDSFVHDRGRSFYCLPLTHTVHFPCAGVYAVSCLYFEKEGGAGLEFSVARGNHSRFDSSKFKLVGDPEGGIVMVGDAKGGGCGGLKKNDLDSAQESATAKKLQSCDFLLNKDFKKNAKYYLCLFSASWCGPCRAEMPRIAKTYAETLKDDPDIELIHFSHDQNDEKALAWAKEHDVKFPVVKYNGGNPLDLRARGIPHLFIVKADGTVVEDGHPGKLFTDEKLRSLIRDKSISGDAKRDEVKLPYEVVGGAVVLRARAPLFGLNTRRNDRKYVAVKFTQGALVIPDVIDGLPVKGIGYGAFTGCKGVTSVTIPSSVTNITDSAFSGCNEITSFSVDASNPSYSSRDRLLCSKDGTTLVVGVNGEVVIPSCVTRIGKHAFAMCRGLTSVTIPSSVTSIENGAFDGCSASMFDTETIAGVKLVDSWAVDHTGSLSGQLDLTGIRGIGDEAFASCSGLTSVTIGNGVTSIGDRAFSGCKGLVSVIIPSSVTNIGENAFGGLSGSRAVFPQDESNGLKSFSVAPDNPSYSSRNGMLCTKDGSILIVGVNGDIVIPEVVTSVESGAFSGCSGLTSVTIPSSVTNICACVFASCSGLTSVTSIGWGAFYGCSGLTSVTIPPSVTSIGSYAFNGTPFYNNMPDGMVVLGGGVLCGYKGKCPSAVEIPSNVTSIAERAFSLRGPPSLQNVRPAGLLRLNRRDAGPNGRPARPLRLDRSAGLKEVVISSSVTNIGNRAFSFCDDLANVTMRGERPDAPKNIFEVCGKLKSIHVPANAKSWAGMKEWQGIPLVFDAK